MNAAERERLILEHLGLVRAVASSVPYRPGVLDHSDLVQHGTIGLIQAIDRYHPRPGHTLSQFVSFRIRGEIVDTLRKLDHLTRYERRRRMDMTPLISLEAPAGPDVEDMTIGETIEDEGAFDTERIAERLDLAMALRRLPPRERRLLALHFGAGLEWTVIADRLRVPKASIYFHRHRVLNRLRSVLDPSWKDA